MESSELLETSAAPASAEECFVAFDDVSYTPPGSDTPVICHLNLQVASGEVLVLLGESGCGKTTTLRLINRLLLPSEGQVKVAGKATSAWDAIALRRMTGYVIQDSGLFPHYTINQNIALVPNLLRWSADQVNQRTGDMLRLVGLDAATFGQRYPGELSGGQKQRVGVARALAADPPLLLMDEPFGALDPLTRAELQKEFAALHAELKKTVVFVTHDVREALLLGSRIALMDRGRLRLLLPPEEFLASEDEHARAYRETLLMVDVKGSNLPA